MKTRFLALTALISTACYAQTDLTQSGDVYSAASPITVANGVRIRLPAMQLRDATGAPFGTALNPIYVSGGGGGGGGSNAAAFATGSTNPGTGSVTDYLGSDNVTHHWVGDTAGHPFITIFGAIPAGTNAIGSITNTSFGVSSLPAIPTGTNSIGTVGLNAGNNVIGSTQNYVGWDETAGQTSLAASAASTNSIRACPAYAAYFNAHGYSTQSGILYVTEQIGGSGSYLIVAQQNLTPGSITRLRIPRVGAADSFTAYIQNGATAATAAVSTSCSAS